MKTAFIVTGSANMYCGSCMRDNTLATAMLALGHEVTMLPMYTPLRLDEENATNGRIFYGGIEAYLLQRFPQPSWWRSALLRLSGAPALLKLMTRVDIGAAVDPAKNAAMTISMLKGETGHQDPLLQEMVAWLADELRPDLVHLTNTLISGSARMLKQRLGVPLVCGLHGEDIFLDGLPEPYHSQAMDLVRRNAAEIDHFIAISQYYIDFFVDRIGVDRSKVTLVRPGIALADYRDLAEQRRSAEPPRPGGPAAIGYLARLSPEKGLHVLVQAFIHLCASGEFPGLRLKVAGYRSRSYEKYVQSTLNLARKAGVEGQIDLLGTVDRSQKLAFFSSIDLFSVPTVYRDPKGLPVLEALACGVPVVQPDHGAFPELVNGTGGGLLHRPEDPLDLAEKLASLLRDPDRSRALGQAGCARVREYFNAERMATETITVYRKVSLLQ